MVRRGERGERGEVQPGDAVLAECGWLDSFPSPFTLANNSLSMTDEEKERGVGQATQPAEQEARSKEEAVVEVRFVVVWLVCCLVCCVFWRLPNFVVSRPHTTTHRGVMNDEQQLPIAQVSRGQGRDRERSRERYSVCVCVSLSLSLSLSLFLSLSFSLSLLSVSFSPLSLSVFCLWLVCHGCVRASARDSHPSAGASARGCWARGRVLFARWQGSAARYAGRHCDGSGQCGPLCGVPRFVACVLAVTQR